MDTDRAHIIKNNSRKRSSGSKAKTRKGCYERDIMDTTNLSTLKGYVFKISTIPNLPSPFPGVDRTRNLPVNFIRAGQRPARTREVRYQGGVLRGKAINPLLGVIIRPGPPGRDIYTSRQAQLSVIFSNQKNNAIYYR